jgi:hypothetical protein
MTTESNVSNETLRDEVRTWLTENWTADLKDELNKEGYTWGASPQRKPAGQCLGGPRNGLAGT